MLNNLPMYLLNNNLKRSQNQLKKQVLKLENSLSAETKSSGRKELPEVMVLSSILIYLWILLTVYAASLQDLFTASYVSAPAVVPGWQNDLPYGMGFGLQYYPNAIVSCALGISNSVTSMLILAWYLEMLNFMHMLTACSSISKHCKGKSIWS